MPEDALNDVLRNRIELLENQIEALKGTIYGQEQYNWAGLMAEVKRLETEQSQLRTMLAAFEAREEKREWEKARSERFNKAALSLILTIVSALSIQALSGLFFGG